MRSRRFTAFRTSIPIRWATVVVGCALATVSGVAAADPGSLSDRKRSVEQRLEDARTRAAEARSQEAVLAGVIAETSAEIDVVKVDAAQAATALGAAESRLASAQRELVRLSRELRALSDRLRELRRQLTIGQGRLAERVVEIYTSDAPDPVGIMLGAASLEDLLDQVELYGAVVDQDSSLVRQIRGVKKRATVQRAKTVHVRKRQVLVTAELAQLASERRSAYEAMAAKEEALTALRAERSRSLAAVTVDRTSFEAEATALEAESANIAELIAAAAAAAPPAASAVPAPPSSTAATSSAGARASSGFVWPVQGSVSSPFGARWGRMHEGIDITAPAGATVVASTSGTVIHAGSMGGYGLLVLIQHPGGIVTAYAHNSSIAVGVGASVAQGQQIASVGCTGSCSGNHVHFEVRVGGSPTDPMNYL